MSSRQRADTAFFILRYRPICYFFTKRLSLRHRNEKSVLFWFFMKSSFNKHSKAPFRIRHNALSDRSRKNPITPELNAQNKKLINSKHLTCLSIKSRKQKTSTFRFSSILWFLTVFHPRVFLKKSWNFTANMIIFYCWLFDKYGRGRAINRIWAKLSYF